MRLLEVTKVVDMTPRMRRIILHGDMTGFVSLGHADHIKAFFFPPGVEPKTVSIGERGAELALGEKADMRDYTPRYWDIASGTLHLDFVLHGDGPASRTENCVRPTRSFAKPPHISPRRSSTARSSDDRLH